jgi:dihydroorotate dehydrogenase (NAD+) catalytic subunit
MAERPDLTVDLGRGLLLHSPVMVASGTFGYGFDASQVDRSALGAIVSKGTTLRPREGNAPIRIAETPSGMLNAIGLQNPGVEYVARVYAPQWATWDLPVIVNVAGDSVDEYVAVARRLNGVAGKLTPNVTDIVAVARAVEGAGADAVSAINTYIGMAIDVRQRRPIISRGSGGLSGPAIKPLALHAVWQVAAEVHIPVIGVGGIMTPGDALEFLLAGAAAVQLGTVNYVRPQAAVEINDGIAAYLVQQARPDLRTLPIRSGSVLTHV